MTKSHLLILKLVLISIITIGCSTSPNFVFYHSEAGIPQASKAVKSTFKLIETMQEGLPFGVIATIDKDEVNNTNTYYVILSLPLFETTSTNNNSRIPQYSKYYTVQSYIHPNHVTLNNEKVSELITILNKSINSFNVKQNFANGESFEYTISKENNISHLTSNVEQWIPDFKYIYKTYNGRTQAFINLGVIKTTQGNQNYSFYLEKEQVIEFKSQLIKALEELKAFGLE